MKQLRVTVQVKNNLLIERREGLGLTQRDCASAVDVPLDNLRAYECLRRQPLVRVIVNGCEAYDWRDDAMKIAAFYEVDPETLWPNAVLRIDKPVMSRTLDVEQLHALVVDRPRALLPDGAETRVAEKELAAKVQGVLAELTPNEATVIKARFGFDGVGDQDEMTLARLGASLGLSRERVRQIEIKALRKLRMPGRASQLRDFSADDGTRRYRYLDRSLSTSVRCSECGRWFSDFDGAKHHVCFAEDVCTTEDTDEAL